MSVINSFRLPEVQKAIQKAVFNDQTGTTQKIIDSDMCVKIGKQLRGWRGWFDNSKKLYSLGSDAIQMIQNNGVIFRSTGNLLVAESAIGCVLQNLSSVTPHQIQQIQHIASLITDQVHVALRKVKVQDGFRYGSDLIVSISNAVANKIFDTEASKRYFCDPNEKNERALKKAAEEVLDSENTNKRLVGLINFAKRAQNHFIQQNASTLDSKWKMERYLKNKSLAIQVPRNFFSDSVDFSKRANLSFRDGMFAKIEKKVIAAAGYFNGQVIWEKR